jgi:hypothetical protein
LAPPNAATVSAPYPLKEEYSEDFEVGRFLRDDSAGHDDIHAGVRYLTIWYSQLGRAAINAYLKG